MIEFVINNCKDIRFPRVLRKSILKQNILRNLNISVNVFFKVIVLCFDFR